MTICIAAASSNPYAIVAVSDMMLSDDVSSLDVATVKTQGLADPGSKQKWYCMYSGTTSTFEELVEDIRERMQLHPDAKESQRGMQKVVEAAYASVIARRIESEILAPFGISRDMFYATGLERFGGPYFRELSEECRRVRLDVDLIVFGFPRTVPVIFTAQKETSTCVSNQQLGFQAIGAGAWSALASLYTHEWRNRGLHLAAYRACEAKFASEMARSVGRATVVEVFYPDGVERWFIAEDYAAIRATWEEHRDHPIPLKVLALIGEGLAAFAGGTKPREKAEPDPLQTTYPAQSEPSK